ncbi:MAG: hypothetical protein ABIG85_05165 [Chloroflexota bacterium]
MRHGPPRHPATGGDTLFALGVAALGLVLAGGLLAAGGGSALLDRFLPGSSATAGPVLPTASAAVAPASSPSPAVTPVVTAPPSPTPVPTSTPAASGPFTMNLYRKGVFVHQYDKESCVAAAALNMLNVIRLVEDGRKPDISTETQRALYARIVKLTTNEDSHNGGTGPSGWAALLAAEGYPYEVRAYASRDAAMSAAATAVRASGRPVGLLTWAGVHSWVMTGFTATADPAATTKSTVTATFVLDPWYPWVSTRWPRSEAPNLPRDAADMKANFLPFSLKSGPYPGRDGKYLIVVPVEG